MVFYYRLHVYWNGRCFARKFPRSDCENKIEKKKSYPVDDACLVLIARIVARVYVSIFLSAYLTPSDFTFVLFALFSFSG